MQVGHIETIPFGIEHLDRATQLSREAGWPHRLQDWQVACLLYTSPSPRDLSTSRMPSSA